MAAKCIEPQACVCSGRHPLKAPSRHLSAPLRCENRYGHWENKEKKDSVLVLKGLKV